MLVDGSGDLAGAGRVLAEAERVKGLVDEDVRGGLLALLREVREAAAADEDGVGADRGPGPGLAPAALDALVAGVEADRGEVLPGRPPRGAEGLGERRLEIDIEPTASGRLVTITGIGREVPL